jgi:AGZA family xanthine/uracil permease-like MFS transporter
MCAILVSGLVKGVLAFCSNWIHRVVPRAGLLGSLAAIALVLIAFTQMPKLAANPIVGFASLVIVLVTLVGRQSLPFKIPGALGAVLAGCAIWYLLVGAQWAIGTELIESTSSLSEEPVLFPTAWLTAFRFEWLGSFGKMLPYLGYIVPFAIVTVIGGIDCAESAASVGDDFRTDRVIGIEAIATLLAAFCGGVIQTTPYIGHPAYKAMGGRAAYTLATALFVGGAGLIGYFSYLFILIPEAAVLPILVFIGIEITAQSFHATPRRHYAALAVACLPALAKLVMIYLGQFAKALNYDQIAAGDAAYLQSLWLHLSVLAGGFILTSLIWASATARIIDRRYFSASVYLAVGGILTLFGLMHSPFFGDKMFWPWQLFDENVLIAERKIVIEFAAAYLVMALLIFGLGAMLRSQIQEIDTDEDFERLL